MAERFVRTFKQAMKAGCADSLTLQHRLANFLLTFHTTPHATTNEPPCILFLGRSLRTRLDLLGPDRERTVVSSQARQKSQHDLHSHHRAIIAVGQRVLALIHVMDLNGCLAESPNYLVLFLCWSS